jgi:CubicO group peptidase (beta-lactamase class C family)
MLFSLSKSFASTAVGFAVGEGRLSVDDSVLAFFRDEALADPDENLKAMRVRHLLSMSTGHDKDTTGSMAGREDGDWAKGFLSLPVGHVPGTHFVYNSGATYMLSAIVQRLTGETLLDYLTPRLLDPLGIENSTWESCPKGVNFGGWGLSVRTEDVARFGQLYLQDGVWNGERILPEGWVEEATRAHVSNGTDPDSDWQQGYGYQFWRCRHGAYRGDGAFGQFCVVIPEQDSVLAVTSGVGDMQGALSLAWDHLLPAMGPAPLHQSADAGELARRLSGLSLPCAKGAPSSPTADRVTGRTFEIDENDRKVQAVTFDFTGETLVLTQRDGDGEHRIECGYKAWLNGETALDRGESRPVSASGAWTEEDTYTVQLCYPLTPFCSTLTFRFEGDRLYYDQRENVSFGPRERPQRVGRLA